MIYRDLKPENILLDEVGHICLTDFGLSKESVSTPNAARTFCGTPEYLAPEILQGIGHGKAVDWWSLGTLVFEMLTGLPPFYSRNINHMYEKILKARLAACRDRAAAPAVALLLLVGLDTACASAHARVCQRCHSATLWELEFPPSVLLLPALLLVPRCACLGRHRRCHSRCCLHQSDPSSAG